jgi:geranylgeranyl pyrophosphate synthase
VSTQQSAPSLKGAAAARPTPGRKPSQAKPVAQDIITGLGFDDEMGKLRQRLQDWMRSVDPAMREMLDWQFNPRSKYFRPLTIFACYRARSGGDLPEIVIERAVVLELMQNVTLIVDDILDRSEKRRGVDTLHHRFGLLPSLMAAGYIAAEGYRMAAGQPHDIRLFSELLKRLGVAECVQWATRRQPGGYKDWLALAQEDTGSMFEVCARLATQDESLRLFGRMLGMLYHGCDDVADVKGLESLGGGGEDDLRDGILTLPASLAIQDARIQAMFCAPKPTDDELRQIAAAMSAQLSNAENKLDALATEAKWQAQMNSRDPEVLYTLVEYTRRLSRK